MKRVDSLNRLIDSVAITSSHHYYLGGLSFLMCWLMLCNQGIKSDMSNISKQAEWNVFINPAIEPVQYYSLLKKKREFSQLIQKKNGQVFINGYSHYCCIIPKNLDCNFDNIYEVIILFIDDTPNRSFIGFRVKACKNSFIHEASFLLLVLKKLCKAICYFMTNNIIHVKCDISEAWEIFYNLYEEYLRRYVGTVIGTQFFNSIIYSSFIQNEKMLLLMLYKGSKVVRISKKSVFFKIHRKRKLSITDLIYITHNMPKNKKSMSCFRFKKLPVISKENKFCLDTSMGNTSNFTHLKMKKFQKNSHDDALTHFKLFESQYSYLHSSSHKRKFEQIERCSNEPANKCFIPSCEVSKCVTDRWEKYASINPQAIDSYSDIPAIKHVVPCLLNDFSNSENPFSFSIHSEMLPFSSSSIKNVKTEEVILDVKNIFEVKHNHQGCRDHLSGNIFSKNIISVKKSNASCINRSQAKLPSFPNSFNKDIPYISHGNSNDLKNLNETILRYTDDINFSTATGKTINISSNALLAAHEIMKDVFSAEEKSTYTKACISENKCNQNSFRVDHYSNHDINKKLQAKTSTTEYANSKCIKNINASEKFENIDRYDEFIKIKNSFEITTADGKNINVSNAAILRAQKIMQDVFADDENIARSCPSSSKIAKYNSSALKKSGYSDEFMSEDIDIDGTLVEKLFEDIPFDDKEIEQAETISVNNSNSDTAINNLAILKPRKSLGVRRNIKYSEKL